MDQKSSLKKSIWPTLLNTIKIFLISLGTIALILVIIAFTPLPYRAIHWLGTTKSRCIIKPEFIIMFGGSGMPSENNLIRLYYTAAIADKYNTCKIIIAHPLDSAVYADMVNELTIRDIDSTRIYFEKRGTNTRSQILNISKNFPQLKNSGIIIITSPEHIYRSILAFRKLGYKKIFGVPAFESDMYVDLSFSAKKIGGKKFIPDIGRNLSIRYNFWSYLKMEITCLREYTALLYYWLNNWI